MSANHDERHHENQLEGPPEHVADERNVEHVETDVVFEDGIGEAEGTTLREHQPVLPPRRRTETDEDPEERRRAKAETARTWLHPGLITHQELFVRASRQDAATRRHAVDDEQVEPEDRSRNDRSRHDKPEAGEDERRPHADLIDARIPQVVGPECCQRPQGNESEEANADGDPEEAPESTFRGVRDWFAIDHGAILGVFQRQNDGTIVHAHSSRAGGIAVPAGMPSLMDHEPLFAGHSRHGRSREVTERSVAPRSASAAATPR